METNKEGLKALLIEASNIPKLSENPTKEDILEKIEAITEVNLDSKWDKVKEMMEGPYAERFMKAMENLSDREFIRVYGKMIEYFKPKVIRVEGTKEKEEDNVLKIEIYTSSKPAVDEDIIDITHEEDGTK